VEGTPMSTRTAAGDPSLRRVLCVTAAACLALAGCKSSSPDPSKSSTTSTSSSPASTASTTHTSPSDEARAVALSFVTDYFATLDRVGSDPSVSLNTLHNVAVSPQFDVLATAYGKNRSLGHKQSGLTKVATSKATSVNLTNTPKAHPPVYPTVHIAACIDVSQVVVRDAKGAKVITADRPNYFVEDLTVVNLSYPDRDGWRVSKLTNRGTSACADG
jgi:hypothetical protein